MRLRKLLLQQLTNSRVKDKGIAMANTKEIQARISSIQDTMKITKAMYMMSSVKLRKAKQKLEGYRTLLLWITGSDKKYIISFSYYAASFL